MKKSSLLATAAVAGLLLGSQAALADNHQPAAKTKSATADGKSHCKDGKGHCDGKSGCDGKNGCDGKKVEAAAPATDATAAPVKKP